MTQRSAIFRPWILAALLAVGAGVFLAVAVFWLARMVSQLIREDGVYRDFVVTSEGTPLVITYGDYSNPVFETLDGQPVGASAATEMRLSGAPLQGAAPPAGPFFQLGWQQRIVVFGDPGPPRLLWYFVHDGQPDGSGYFAGFDAKTCGHVGYLGTQGFRRDEPPPEECFPVDGRLMKGRAAFDSLYPSGYPYGLVQHRTDYSYGDERFLPWMAYMISGDRLLEIDFRKRSVRAVLEAEGLLSANRAQQSAPLPSDGQKRYIPRLRASLAVRTGDRVRLLDPFGGPERSYTLPEAVRGAEISFYERHDGTALATTSRYTGRAREQSLFQFDPAGRVLRQDRITQQVMVVFDRAEGAAWMIAGAIPVPILAPFTVTAGYASEYMLSGEEPNYPRALVRALGQAWPPLLAVFVVGGVAAWLCYRRQRRFALPWTAAWVALVFLGGVPGLVGYLVHRRWPPLEACGACGELVPRDRGQCAHCGADFPPPAPKGIEVFAA